MWSTGHLYAGLENGSEKNLGFLGLKKTFKKPEKSKI